MSDKHRDCPSPLVPGLIGGVIGAALVDASRQQDAARLRREMEGLAAIERARLAEEQKRLALAQAESDRNESDRTYRHAVLWLEHCSNDERLDWLVQQHGPALADTVVARLLDDARRRPDIAALFAEDSAAEKHSRQVGAARRAREKQLTALRRRRWTGAGVWLCGAVIGGPVFLAFYATFGMATVAGYVLFLAAFAAVSPLIVRLQGTPVDLAAMRPGHPLPRFMRHSIARLEVSLDRANTDFSTATIEHALAREALAQAFATLRPALLAEALRHVGAIRPQLDELQKIYPPRIRCELAALLDAALHARLAPHLPAALDRGLASLIS